MVNGYKCKVGGVGWGEFAQIYSHIYHAYIIVTKIDSMWALQAGRWLWTPQWCIFINGQDTKATLHYTGRHASVLESGSCLCMQTF